MKNTTPISKKEPIKNRTIDLELAKIRVTRWLNAVGDMPAFKKDPDTIPRAIFIEYADITELIEAYPAKDLKGIRIYFGLAGEDDPAGATVNDMRGMIVPVLYAEEFRQHKDYIIKPGDSPDPNDTSIYDFTAPCPVYCDKQSELYVPFPDPQG